MQGILHLVQVVHELLDRAPLGNLPNRPALFFVHSPVYIDNQISRINLKLLFFNVAKHGGQLCALTT